jgi:hypothetical protein
VAPSDHADNVLSRLAPIGHKKHINMRGILTFDLTRYGSSLLHQAPQAAGTVHRAKKAESLVLSTRYAES